MLNEIFFLQSACSIALIFFIGAANLLTLWYLAGIYLLSLGALLLLDDGDIFVGFLWVVDLGVGLIFLIFILHFVNFLHQRVAFDFSARTFLFFIIFLAFIALFQRLVIGPLGTTANRQLRRCWFFFISWYNYYTLYHCYAVTDLALLRESYFCGGAFGFFLINFMLLYGIFSSISICFLMKRVFAYLNSSQALSSKTLNEANGAQFIRSQNFMRQQNTPAGARVWIKSARPSKNGL